MMFIVATALCGLVNDFINHHDKGIEEKSE